MKTKETLDLEKALQERAVKRREYGTQEVTVGFAHDGHGDEIADFMTIDSDGIVRCYELKVSLADLRSEAKKSWYGDYNYLVVSDSLDAASPNWGNYIPPYVGILVGKGLKTRRSAKKKEISEETRNMLRDSLIRTLFWKMEGYRDADSLEKTKELQKKLKETEEAFDAYKITHDRLVFEAEDYALYYGRNHQAQGVSLTELARRERREYFQRQKGQMTWVNGRCPVCGYEGQESDWCPACGSDLRRLAK
ncbi:MAG: hypothetical protein IKD69_04870 [Solobacterium sp.]|nr:hypothetical protein [Solobacterium sp.]